MAGYEYEAEEGLGIELEVDLGADAANCADEIDEHFPKHFVFERDGSLSEDGFEIISQPHTVEAFYQVDWQYLFTILDNYSYKPAPSCGLHVHVSNSMLGDTVQQQNTAKLLIMLFYQKYWETFVKLSRRESKFHIEHYCHKTTITKENIKDYYCWINNHSMTRYHAVNIANYSTTEFRLCASTFDIDHFLAWIDITLSLVCSAMAMTFDMGGGVKISIEQIEENFDKFMEDTITPENMLQGLKNSTLEYLRKEKIKFDIATEEKVSL